MPNRRRKPSPTPSEATATPTPTWPQAPARTCLILPLDYMLSVVNDPMAEPARRDKCAIAAAPYCHARLAEKTKKAGVAEAASRAGGSESGWDNDLDGSWAQ